VDPGTRWPPPAAPAATRFLQVERGEQDAPGQRLIEALRAATFPEGRCFVWVAVESTAARRIRSYLREERRMDKAWIKAAGYWQRGAAGKHDSISNDE
jgi:NADPH-dependent ferric siderophore reductase